MSKKLRSACEHFSENTIAFPAILAVLGDQLGVPVEPLLRLGVGWVPCVRFNKGWNHSGWWTIPERDENGEVVGIGLRSRDGTRKVMYPGSKHGLIYDPDGAPPPPPVYTPGKHNWIRTMEAGLDCPICGKPDGCLLSAENPEDPKAVMCTRQSLGAVHPVNANGQGWLHHRKPEAVIDTPTPGGTQITLIVEGMTDVAIALMLGFNAVGRPSDRAGMKFLKASIRGRDCVIVGENDKKPDGRHPGKEGMEAAFETIKNVASRTRKVLPPTEFKDLREWVVRGKLNAEALRAYVESNAESESNSNLLESDEPLRIAERWLQDHHYVDGIPILRKTGGEWFRFDGQRYGRLHEESEIRGRLYAFLSDRLVQYSKPDGTVVVERYIPDRTKITNIIDALTRDCPIKADPPCWLDRRKTPNPVDLICFPNGIWNWKTKQLMDISPLLFTFNVMPYEYDPEAECPLWQDFLREVFPFDIKKIMLLQEWFGYNLIADVSMQKMMLMIGPGGTGKSTVMHVKTAMLGQDQVAVTSFDSLGEKYGMGQLIGKLAADVPDGHVGRYTDTRILVERLKVLTGENNGRIQVRRMREDAGDAKFFARITIATNELPELPDESNSMYRRMLGLQFTQSFVGREDRDLPNRLAEEAPGVFNWAVEGLERLKRQGRFTIPKSSADLIRSFTMVTSPLQQFSAECCRIGAEFAIPVEMAYRIYRNWCKDRGVTCGLRSKFVHNVLMNFTGVREGVVEEAGVKISRFEGMTIEQHAREKYLVS